jgi:putative cardiolipin synthase
LRPLTDAATNEVVIVSPYFVPGKRGVAFFKALRKRGIRVVVLTNSLGSTDVAAVHAGYRRYRKPLLRDGVELYEAKASGHRPEKENKRGLSGSSRASLHAKSFVFDRRTVFVGSLNLDPRSIQLNTEVGIVFENAQLAAELTDRLEQNLTEVAYRVELAPSGSGLRWSTHEGGELVQRTAEPECGFWRKLSVECLALLPIENQL